MTVASTTNRADLTITSGTSSYPYAFRIFADGDLSVVRRHPTTGSETALVLNTDYTVTGAGNANGGTIVISSGNATTYNGYGLTIRRVLATTQSTSIRNQGAFYPEVHEDVFDRLAMVDQQQQEEIDRSVKLPETVSASEFDPTLPAGVTTGAGRTLLVNATGDGFEMGPTATEISSAQAAATAALAALDSFDDRYLGAKASDPTVDNDGNSLLEGAMYFNSATKGMRVYNGTVWQEIASSAFHIETFSGDGVTTAFTLAISPVNKNNTDIFIGGVYQAKSNYSLSNKTITFTAAPPSGTNNIEIVYPEFLPVATADADNVQHNGVALTSDHGSSIVGFIQSAAGAQEISVETKLLGMELSASEFSTLTQAFAAASGRKLRLDADYSSAVALTLPVNATLDLQGHTLTFTVTGSANCLELRSGCNVMNGSIVLAGSGYTGHGGNGCPIVIGNYGVGTGYNNITVDSVTITSNKANGNGIMVTGDSNNVRIRNITFPDSGYIGRPILIHWGGADNPTAGTTHPYNVEVDNIKCGSMADTSSDAFVVAVSGAYNVDVRNVFSSGSQNGILLVAGDYSTTYAPSAVKGLLGKNITLNNVMCCEVRKRGAQVDGLGNSSIDLQDIAVLLEKCTFRAASTNADYGVSFANCNGPAAKNCEIYGFGVNVQLFDYTTNVVIDGNQVINSKGNGLSASGANVTYPRVTNNSFLNSNASDNSYASNNSSHILLSPASNAIIKDNTFGGSGCLAYRAIRISTTCVAPVLVGNYTSYMRAGGTAYEIGAGSTDYALSCQGRDNTAASGITLSNQCPVFTYNQFGRKEWYGTAAPTSGTHTAGDRVWYAQPAAGGVMGAICTTGGTPGTWKAMASIAP